MGIASRYREPLAGAIVLVGLYLTSRYSYLLFHSIVEIFTIVVAVSIFMLAWNARRFMDNGYLLFLGSAFLFIGGLDLLHTLAYKGMGVFTQDGTNLPTQLWLATRYLAAFSFLVAPFLLRRRVNLSWVFIGYTAASALLVASIFVWKIFPVAYVDGSGLTDFKRISELVISFLFLVSLGLLWRHRAEFDPHVLNWIVASIAAGTASEMLFTSYASVYDLANLIGHMFDLLSFYLIYKAIVATGFNKPYDLVFHDLKQSEQALLTARDQLEERVAERTGELREANEQLRIELAERKKAEEEVRRLNAELEQRVRDRTAQLEESNQELEAFTYSASHDLRTPLTSMSGFAALLEEEYGPHLAPDARHYIRIIRQGAEEMACLIEDLFSFSRASRQPLNKVRVSMADLVLQVITELAPSEKGRRVEFSIGERGQDPEEALPPCLADPILLKQVYMNLISNAIKFTRKREVARIEIGCRGSAAGGDKLEVGSRREEAGQASSVELQSAAPATIYYVRDNGVGFDMKNAARLFGVFQRLHNSDDYPGTGLGLAIVDRIIRRLGGRIWAEAEVDKGAAFFFTLCPAEMEGAPGADSPGLAA